MARKSDIDADLVFEMDGVDITPDKFVQGVRAFFTLLTEIMEEVCSEDDGVHWRVQVKAGSNLIEAIPDPGAAPVCVEAILDSMNEGVERLENMEDEPAGWTPKAISSLKTIGALSGVNEDDDTSMQIWVQPATTAAHPAPVSADRRPARAGATRMVSPRRFCAAPSSIRLVL